MAASNPDLSCEFGAACSNSLEKESLLQGNREITEQTQNDLCVKNVTDNGHGSTNGSVQNRVNGTGEEAHHEHEAENQQDVIDININNVVCSFNVRCHINLKRLAMEGANVEYRREHGICNMKLRRPHVTANITSSGKITVTGSTSEDEAKIAGRRVARRLQKLGFNVRFFNFRIVNVLGTCSLPFGIKLNSFSMAHPQEASYEPELHPGVTYKIKSPKATLKIFSTGSITVTAPSVSNVGNAIEHIYPLVSEHVMEKRAPAQSKKAKKRKVHQMYSHHNAFNGFHDYDDDEDDDEDCDNEFNDEASDMDAEDFDSDVSHD